MDRLATMFEMQRELQLKIGTPSEVIDGYHLKMAMSQFDVDEHQREQLAWHKEFALALMMESAELMDWMAWKHWSRRLGNKADVEPFGMEHVDEVRTEIVDVLHFVLNLALMWGMTPESLFQMYAKKNEVNHDRQDSRTY